ncbi:unnamed protein product [Urochloa humidicola]
MDLDPRTGATCPHGWRSGSCTDLADRGMFCNFRLGWWAVDGGEGDGAWPAGGFSSSAPPRSMISLL